MGSKIFCTCFFFFFFLVFAFIISAIITGFVIPPQKVAIINANLTRFELDTNSTSLLYNLTFTMTIHNSVWHHKADYHEMELDCYYSTEQFAWLRLGNFGLKPRRTRVVNFSRNGSSSVNLGISGVDEFRRANGKGFFELTIWLTGTRVFQGDEGDRHVHLSYRCDLKLPLITSQNSTEHIGDFQPVKCP